MKTQALSPVRTLLATLALLLAVNGLMADAVTEAAVKKMATGWLKVSASVPGVGMARAIDTIQSFTDDSGNVLYYAVQLKPEGFLLVAADDQLAPVISFSKSGQYVAGKVPPLTDLVTGESTAKLDKLKQFRLTKTLNAKTSSVLSTNKKSWSFFTAQASGNTRNMTYIDTNNTYVAPLVKSRWNQQSVAGEACYNYYTPSTWTEPDGTYPLEVNAGNINPPPVTWTEGLATNYPTGCSATSKAQLIRYHAYQPAGGIGVSAWEVTVRKNIVRGEKDHQWTQNCNTRGGNGSGGSYDFSKMPLVPDASTTVEERQMIGALLFDCGITNGMNYTSQGSAGNPSQMGLFGYSGGRNVALDEVRANLDAQYPLLVYIWSRYSNIDIAAHSVVCDGYVWYPSGRDATGNMGSWYFHMNMGWGGSEDAWYDASGSYAQIWDYNAAMFTGNIYPYGKKDAYGSDIADADRIISGRVVDGSGSPLQGLTITVTDAANPAHHTPTTTNAKGVYSFVLPPAAYIVTPTMTDYTFTPGNYTVSLYEKGFPDNNFTGVTKPSVATKGVFSVTRDDALFVGGLVATGGSTVTQRGFCWSLAPNPDTDSDSGVVAGTAVGEFSATVSDLGKTLIAKKIYHVRAFSTNGLGSAYGGDFTFKTND